MFSNLYNKFINVGIYSINKIKDLFNFVINSEKYKIIKTLIYQIHKTHFDYLKKLYIFSIFFFFIKFYIPYQLYPILIIWNMRYIADFSDFLCIIIARYELIKIKKLWLDFKENQSE